MSEETETVDEAASENVKVKAQKRKHTNTTEENHNNNNEKISKVFSAKEFRKQLLSQHHDEKLLALKQFLEHINKVGSKRDCIFEYLDKGGSCLEILQTLENDSIISPVLVFEILNHVLLRINSNFAQHQTAAFESCKHLLKNYITTINKMLGLSSTKKERLIILKLLTAIVTFSATLAKEVLLHVNFNVTNLELLTKSTGQTSECVRDAFLHFLTAFLVDGHYPTLSVLLEKRGLLTSIISGLKYDNASVTCIILTAMKNHILENPAVSKTAKMKTFSTPVIRDIISLYNWKGPAGVNADKKGENIVDEYEKSKVNETVHDFLLILCTSFKYGVIFKDHALGTGKKNQNALMYTVVESLERPWEHSYAKQLVIKICCACPDLVKTVWLKLKEFVVPRRSVKWLNAVNFAKELIQELKPQGIMEVCLNEVNAQQVSQIVSILVAPLPILKTIVDESFTSDQAIKYNVMLLFLEMLKAVKDYLSLCKNSLNIEKYSFIKTYFEDYIIKNFPTCETMLCNWYLKTQPLEESSSNEVFKHNILNVLDVIFDTFDYYMDLSPRILEEFNVSDLGLENFLSKIDEFETDDSISENLKTNLKVKAINLFYNVDPRLFSISSDLFAFALPLLHEFYYEFRSDLSIKILNNILKNTLIFESCENEINIWLNALLDLKHFDVNTCEFLISVLKLTHENINPYLGKIAKFNDNNNVQDNDNVTEILQNLQKDAVNLRDAGVIKHTIVSPLLIGCLEYLKEVQQSKYVKTYVQGVFINLFHIQTSPSLFYKIVLEYGVLPQNVLNYIKNWVTFEEIIVLEKGKCKFNYLNKFSAALLFDSESEFKSFLIEDDLNYYPELKLNLLEICVFYVSNLVKAGKITKNHLGNFESYIKFLLGNSNTNFGGNKLMLQVIFSNPVIFSKFSILYLNKEESPNGIFTKFLINLMKILQNFNVNLENFVKVYQNKLVNDIMIILKKPHKFLNFPNFTDTLETIKLDYMQCFKIYAIISEVLPKICLSDDESCLSNVVFEISMYTLKEIGRISKKNLEFTPLNEQHIINLCGYLNKLITKQQQIDLNLMSVSFLEYLEIFPHNIKQIPTKFFVNLLNLNDYNKDVTNLVSFILERQTNLVESVENNLESIVTKKGVFLSILDVMIKINVSDSTLEKMYVKFWPSISKALIKPQKAGQHFQTNFKGVAVLLEKFLPENEIKILIDKVQKYECSEIFHAFLLKTIFKKAITNNKANVKQINNMILTLIHLCMNIFKRKVKTEEDDNKLNEICGEFNNFVLELKESDDFSQVCQNETFKLFCKFCLKFGVSKQANLLKIITNLLRLFNNKNLDENDAKLILEMLISHSEFLDVILNETTDRKVESLSLFLVLCTNWPNFMERSHVPVLLAAYRATMSETDKIILQLLKMYEKEANRTNFYDFKPYLWGRAAASHYSVRQDIQKALWRQPKMGDVLDIIQEDWVLHTIKNYPFKNTLQSTNSNNNLEGGNNNDKYTYDLAFLLPLFSELLAPENAVQTYLFTKCGALSLTIIALTSDDKNIRLASCHILQRLYNHLEVRTFGKDTLLWLRFIEAVCKGLALLDNFKLNNFAGIFLARTALILTQPNNVMYIPLSQYLTAKLNLDFSTIPELYTFLNSNDLNSQHHQHYILELLRDGCRVEKDFTVFQKSMAHKLILELFSSCLCDTESEILILDVIHSISKTKSGCKFMTETYSIIPYLHNKILIYRRNNKKEFKLILEKYVKILYNFALNLHELLYVHCKLCLGPLLCRGNLDLLSENTLELCSKIFLRMRDIDGVFFENFIVQFWIENDDKFCNYLFKYGCNFIKESDVLSVQDKLTYYRLVYFKYLQNKKP